MTEILKLSFSDVKNPSPDETEIVYELIYVDLNRQTKVTQKKSATMIKDPGAGQRWLIRDVRNLSELIEYQNELTFP